jgi:hypothetical protein
MKLIYPELTRREKVMLALFFVVVIIGTYLIATGL